MVLGHLTNHRIVVNKLTQQGEQTCVRKDQPETKIESGNIVERKIKWARLNPLRPWHSYAQKNIHKQRIPWPYADRMPKQASTGSLIQRRVITGTSQHSPPCTQTSFLLGQGHTYTLLYLKSVITVSLRMKVGSPVLDEMIVWGFCEFSSLGFVKNRRSMMGSVAFHRHSQNG